MAEENKVTKEPQQEQQRVTAKDPKKVEVGKRLAAIIRKKREAKKRQEAQNGGMSQYYGFSAILALGVIGGLGYYIYQTRKGEASGEQPSNPQQNNPKPHHLQSGTQGPQTNKSEMD